MDNSDTRTTLHTQHRRRIKRLRQTKPQHRIIKRNSIDATVLANCKQSMFLIRHTPRYSQLSPVKVLLVIEEGKYLLCVFRDKVYSMPFWNNPDQIRSMWKMTIQKTDGIYQRKYAQCGKIESPMIKKNLGVAKPNGLDRVTYCMRERSFSFDNNNNDNIYNEYIIFKNCKFKSKHGPLDG